MHGMGLYTPVCRLPSWIPTTYLVLAWVLHYLPLFFSPACSVATCLPPSTTYHLLPSYLHITYLLLLPFFFPYTPSIFYTFPTTLPCFPHLHAYLSPSSSSSSPALPHLPLHTPSPSTFPTYHLLPTCATHTDSLLPGIFAFLGVGCMPPVPTPHAIVPYSFFLFLHTPCAPAPCLCLPHLVYPAFAYLCHTLHCLLPRSLLPPTAFAWPCLWFITFYLFLPFYHPSCLHMPFTILHTYTHTHGFPDPHVPGFAPVCPLLPATYTPLQEWYTLFPLHIVLVFSCHMILPTTPAHHFPTSATYPWVGISTSTCLLWVGSPPVPSSLPSVSLPFHVPFPFLPVPRHTSSLPMPYMPTLYLPVSPTHLPRTGMDLDSSGMGLFFCTQFHFCTFLAPFLPHTRMPSACVPG